MAEDNKEDPVSEETAAIRRLVRAGKNNTDQQTTDAAIVRAVRLAKKEQKLDLSNPTTAKILGLTHDDTQSR